MTFAKRAAPCAAPTFSAAQGNLISYGFPTGLHLRATCGPRAVSKIIREALRAAASPGDAAPNVMMKVRRRLVAVAAREVKRFIATAAERPRSR
jgi:hypothetical protein